MNGTTLAQLAAILLPGILLLCHGAARLLVSPDGRTMRERIGAFHNRVWNRLVEAGFLPFPGIRLISSRRPLLAGEVVCAGILALSSLSPHATWTGFLSILPVAVAVGLLAIVLAARDLARKQVRALRASLPIASFLLSLLLEAGIGSHVALEEVSGALPAGPLGEELKEISRSRKLGLPRREAFDRSRSRIPLDDYHTFLNLIQQGEELGVGLSRALREHSEALIEKQRQRAEAFAQKAAVRILLPLVLFIFPAVFLVILSPAILNLLEIWRG